MKKRKFSITTLENIIIDAWKKELHINSIRVSEDFFDLGGNSITLINILDNLQKRINIAHPNKLTMMDLFEYTTVQSLTEYLFKLQEPIC